MSTELAKCILCGEPGELRHTMDGSAIVRCPNVCIATQLRPGVTDEEAVGTWNAVMGARA